MRKGQSCPRCPRERRARGAAAPAAPVAPAPLIAIVAKMIQEFINIVFGGRGATFVKDM